MRLRFRNGIDGEATRLVFDRRPQAGRYEVHYVQAPQLLEADGDTFDGVAGFEFSLPSLELAPGPRSGPIA